MTNSIFDTLTVGQVEDLIQEEELKLAGYIFYYTVDQHDIGKYCYPFGVNPFLENNYTTDGYSIDYISDQFTALIGLFEDPNATFFLLDQYWQELVGLRGTILDVLFRNIKLYDYNTFVNYLLNNWNNSIKNDLGLLISSATGALQEGAQRYNSFVGGKLIVDFEEFDDVVTERPTLKPLKEAFEHSVQTRPDVVERLRQEFSKNKELPSQRAVAVQTDCEAIDRICQINSLIIENNKRSLLLFLSSARASRETYFAEESSILTNYYPRIEGKLFRFHRTSAQLFVQLLLQDDEDLKRLATLKEMKEVVEKRTKTIGNESNSFEVVFKERIDILRNRYAREKLLKQINEFRELFEQLQQAGGRFGRLSTLYNNLVAERADRSEELEKSSKGILSTINFELEFKEHYLQWLESRASKTPNFIIQRGKDPVFGTAHHLPLLFENGGNQKELISQITQRYIRDEVEALKSKANAADLDANIEDLIKKQTTESFAHQGKPEPEDILVRSLLNLIIPFDRTKKKSYTPEEMVIQVAKKQIDLIAFEGDVLLLGDYYYLLCWACRRDKQYERSRKYAELGKQLNENDPRFWHGLFLYNYCEFRECIKKTTLTIEGNASSALPFLGKAIETSQKALEKYESWLTDAKRTEDPIVLKKTKAALMTGIIIVHAYLYAIEGDIDFLTKSREVTQDLKKFEGTAYGQQPEYLYVESFLEYQEYCEFQKKNQSELAQRKLQQARAAIESACKAIPDRSQYSAWKKELAKLT